MKQILINLLSNSVKFTPSGGSITVGSVTGTATVYVDLDIGSVVVAGSLSHFSLVSVVVFIPRLLTSVPTWLVRSNRDFLRIVQTTQL